MRQCFSLALYSYNYDQYWKQSRSFFIGNLHIFVCCMLYVSFPIRYFSFVWFLDLRLNCNYLNLLNYMAVEYWIAFEHPLSWFNSIWSLGVPFQRSCLVYFFLLQLNYSRFSNICTHIHREERQRHSHTVTRTKFPIIISLNWKEGGKKTESYRLWAAAKHTYALETSCRYWKWFERGRLLCSHLVSLLHLVCACIDW